MKKIYLFAAMAAMLASCSSDDLLVEKQTASQAVESSEAAVDFDVYVGRGLTRGGIGGPVTTTSLQTGDHSSVGFGVFGYYTDGEPYSAITKPNFFYNQKVTYDGTSKWTYSPIKYWPNEFGSDAKSDQVDRVTLFAYLPWVEVDPLTGVVKPATPTVTDPTDPTTNITGMTRNTATGDPFIKYVATMNPANSVDLCYGVAAERFTSSNSAENTNKIAKGEPYIDVVKPATDDNSKIKFDFKHATAQMKVTIDAKVDDKTNDMATAPYNDNGIDTDHSRIWVRSVTFTGITQKGALNLNSKYDQPEWYDINGNSKITTGSLTVFDGRKDGKEANDAASNELPATLNPNIIQDAQYTIDAGKITKPTKLGVTKTKINLFNGNYAAPDNIQPVFVIPTKEKMRVTIVYDVETYDTNLPYYLSDGKTPGSTVQNTIYKDIDAFGEIAAGYCYTLNLHLGMRTVDFDATVTPWQDMQADVDLPSNLQTFEAAPSASSKTGEVILPADAATYDFAVSGLTANAPVTPTWTTVSGTVTNANGSGIATVNVASIPVNGTTSVKNEGTVKVSDGTNEITVTIKHSAHALGLNSLAYSAGKLTYLLGVTEFANTKAISEATGGAEIKVFRNGVDITSSCTWGDSGLDITLPTGTADGDVYKVYMKVNDAAAETETCTVSL